VTSGEALLVAVALAVLLVACAKPGKKALTGWMTVILHPPKRKKRKRK
jgi:hypothetical protein